MISAQRISGRYIGQLGVRSFIPLHCALFWLLCPFHHTHHQRNRQHVRQTLEAISDGIMRDRRVFHKDVIQWFDAFEDQGEALEQWLPSSPWAMYMWFPVTLCTNSSTGIHATSLFYSLIFTIWLLVMFEITEARAWQSGEPRDIIQDAQARLQTEGWGSTRKALTVTVQ